LAGISGVLITRFARGQVTPSPLNQRLAHTYLAQHAFEPSWQFDSFFSLTPEMLVPWPALEEWIPGRLNHWLEMLAAEIPPHGYRYLRIAYHDAVIDEQRNLTEASLRHVANLGVDVVALELYCTLDARLALAHNGELHTPDEIMWPLCYSCLGQLETLDLGDGTHMPSFAQVLRLCQQEQMGVYLDIKEVGVLPDLVALVNASGMAGDLASYGIIGSFRPDWLADCKALLPQVPTAIQFTSRHLDAVQLARSIRASYLHPRWERYPDPGAFLTPEWTEAARKAGLGILSWPEDRPNQIAALRRLGLDGICTNRPECLPGPNTARSEDPLKRS
jgi:glycerophosphoryl diester phosphodiesterase